MANPPAAGGPPTKDVRRAIENLERRHRKGLALLRRFPLSDRDGSDGDSAATAGRLPAGRPKYATPGEGAFRRLAEREGVTEAELFSRRQFAALYSPEDLAVLLGRRTPSGRPLSWTHVRWLLRVADRRLRLRLERWAAELAWTVAQLRAEIRAARPGSPHAGGRPVGLPESPEARLLVVAAEAARLGKRLTTTEVGTGPRKSRSRRPTPPACVTSIAAATAALKPLRLQISRTLGDLERT